jgi:hypothetical protein
MGDTMASVIFEETSLERQTADAVREEVSRRMVKGEWTVEFVAGQLGLVPVGVEAIMRRRWTFEEAFRIAIAMGVDFRQTLADSEQQAA